MLGKSNIERRKTKDENPFRAHIHTQIDHNTFHDPGISELNIHRPQVGPSYYAGLMSLNIANIEFSDRDNQTRQQLGVKKKIKKGKKTPRRRPLPLTVLPAKNVLQMVPVDFILFWPEP